MVLLTKATYVFVLKLMVLMNLKRVQWMFKLIAPTPLVVDMMTSQGRIVAMFVTNVLHIDRV